uniref:flagellar filament capping protein FliD n=1 Tax=Chitinimonas sp. TaxID=1934313 RepID=UPI0035ADA0A4
AAVLQGDSALRSLQYQMRQLMNGTLAGSGNYRTLSSVGISFDKTGVMTFDSSKLSGALSTSPDSVAALFGVFATSSDSQISYVNSTGNTKAGNYGVSITQLATQGVVRGSAASSKDLSAVATPTLAVQIDGFQSATISLSQKNYASFDDIAADLQSKINGDSTLKAAGITASVSFDSSANRFVIASARYGTSSKAQVSSIDPTLASQLGLSVGTQATLAAGTLLSSTVDATNDTFSISVDGAASTAITLTQGSYTGASLASEIQSKLTGAGLNAIAVYNATANRIELASGTTGTSSAIELTAVGSNSGATLGLATGKGSVTGLDVAGRIGNNAATGSGQYLTGLGDAAGLNILVAGGSASPGGAARGSIAFNKGFAYQLDQLFGAALSDKGVLNADAQGFQSQIDRLEAQDVRFNQRLSRVQALYVQQFTTLDTTIARLRQTSASLSQSLASLPKAS